MVATGRSTAERLVEEAWQLRDHDPEQALNLTDSADGAGPHVDACRSVVRGFVLSRRGQLEESLALIVDVVTELAAGPPSVWQGRASNTAAGIYSGLGLTDQAVNYLIVGYQQSQAVGDGENTFSCLHNMAFELGDVGDIEGALKNFDKAEAFAHEASGGQAFLAVNRCHMYLKNGDVPQAVNMVESERRHWQESGTQGRLYGLMVEAQVALGARDADAAAAALKTLRGEFEEERAGQELVLCEARLAMLRGDHDQAYAILRARGLDEPTIWLEDARLASTLAEVHVDLAEARGDLRLALVIVRSAAARERAERERTKTRVINLLANENTRQLEQKSAQLEEQNRQLSDAMRALKELNEQIQELATRDHLTGLHNRRYLAGHVNTLVRRLDSAGHDLSLLVFDIDDFKAINDRFLHAGGDAVLRQLTQLLRAQTRPDDVLCRLGGDEFVVLLPKLDLEGAEAMAERIQAAVMHHRWSEIADGLTVSVSIGATAASPGASLDELLFAADAAMYRAKSAGKNQVKTAR